MEENFDSENHRDASDLVRNADAFSAAVAQNPEGARTTDSAARELAEALAKALRQSRPTTAVSGQQLMGSAGLDELISSLHFILFARAATLHEALYSREANALMARLEDHLALDGIEAEPSRPDVVDYRTLDPSVFYEKYVLGSRIAVIKNFDCVAWKEWSFEWFMNRFGDERFPLLKLGENPDLFVLPEFTEQVPLRLLFEEPGKYYFANSQELFDRHPDLRDGLNLDEIAGCMKPTTGRSPLLEQSQQFFVSTGPSAATGVHHGHNSNFFFNVLGAKRWTLVHPQFTFLMCAWLRPFDGICAFHMLNEFSQSWIPTLRYLPHYEVVLGPGDVLYNPYYWWHTVDSLSNANMGVSTRWVGRPGDAFQDPFPLATLATQCNPISRQARAEAERDRLAGVKTNWFDRFAHGRSVQFGISNGMKPWGLTWGRPPARN